MKITRNHFCCILAIFFALIIVSCSTDDDGDWEGEYKIGDTGPAGGIVFYTSKNGFWVESFAGATFERYHAHYLEAALINTQGGTGTEDAVRWSIDKAAPYAEHPDANLNDYLYETEIGRGRRNTEIIIAAEKSQNPGNPYIYAALACGKLGDGTEHDDWFLPSLDELAQLCRQKDHFGITGGTYWSSSQKIPTTAWNYQFLKGNLNSYLKHMVLYVRAVRAF